VDAVKHALFSLSDRTGAAALARALAERGVTLWATEGTLKAFADEGIQARAVSELVGQGAWLGGRVKTLHPSLLGGVLARRFVPEDMRDLAEKNVPAFDLVVCTLYPFESLPDDAPWEKVIETIDVGGVTLLRAAAKNCRDVGVLSDPSQYPEALGEIDEALRRKWARAAFERVALYDIAIARRFGGSEMPSAWLEGFRQARTLRYGENPHQEAALYGAEVEAVLEGRELSYNNLVDLDAATALVHEFQGPACVIVKHNEPSGVGLGARALDAFTKAFDADALSAFGGVVAFNVVVDAAGAEALAKPFLECVAAPSFQPAAIEILKAKKNLRVVRVPKRADAKWQVRTLAEGALVQGVRADAPGMKLEVVTRRKPTPEEMAALLIAWTVVGRARSNAIAITRADRTVGIGSGQTSRIDAVEVALMKARRSGHDTRGAVLASDGFFPFGDWVKPAEAAGITCAIQPGGSMRDPESIEACDAAGLALVMTGMRLFRH
jgi:phosphoribosylaminoimidazolecarboxamide formyltransferase/IMP cyclohydrolase